MNPNLSETSNVVSRPLTVEIPAEQEQRLATLTGHEQITPTDDLSPLSPEGERIHTCPVCDATFSRRGNLKAHQATHTGDKPHQCPFCSSMFSRKYNLKNHILTHTGEKPFKCKCGVCFTRKKYLTTHIETQIQSGSAANEIVTAALHQAVPLKQDEEEEILYKAKPEDLDKPFQCLFCLIGFTRKSNLTQHLLSHSGEKPFRCPQCNAQFAKKGNLKSHLLTHSGIKPHTCTICLMTFSRKYNLAKHVLRHTGQRPYVCTECGTSFAQKQNLNSHILTTHKGIKPHKCDHCGKYFSRKAYLKQHLKHYQESNQAGGGDSNQHDNQYDTVTGESSHQDNQFSAMESGHHVEPKQSSYHNNSVVAKVCNQEHYVSNDEFVPDNNVGQTCQPNYGSNIDDEHFKSQSNNQHPGNHGNQSNDYKFGDHNNIQQTFASDPNFAYQVHQSSATIYSQNNKTCSQDNHSHTMVTEIHQTHHESSSSAP